MSKQPTGPDRSNYEEQDVTGDGPDSTWIPPDEPMGSHSYGTTTNEQRRGETFDNRQRHTIPEVFDLDIHEPVPPVGRLLQPGDEDVSSTDEEATTVAFDQGEDDGDMSAEESAMHTIENP